MNTTTDHPILIGCSGWSYPDWEGVIYPPGLRSSEFLEYYADRFPIVEVDSTFYRSPTPRMIHSWDHQTPDGFRFALKVPRVITHEKYLSGCEAEVEAFISNSFTGG